MWVNVVLLHCISVGYQRTLEDEVIEMFHSLAVWALQQILALDKVEIKLQICDVCHKMWQLGWVDANDGNVSARLEDGRVIATPTGLPLQVNISLGKSVKVISFLFDII